MPREASENDLLLKEALSEKFWKLSDCDTNSFEEFLVSADESER